MKLSEYIEHLNVILNNNPKNKDLEVIYSIDDEGNCFRPVCFEPGVGNFEDGDFDVNCTIKQINAVCIN